MKVVCIDNTIRNARHLILGKIYDVNEVPPDPLIIGSGIYDRKNYWVVEEYLLSENGYRSKERISSIRVGKENFISLEEWRSEKISKIF
jgi:hypothetical protein